MKRTGKLSAVWGFGAGVVCAAIVAATASSAGAGGETESSGLKGLTAEVESLRKEVGTLRADVDYLLRQERYTPEEVGYLEEIVTASEATHKRVLELYNVAAPGGEAVREAPAAYRSALAKARLARARGRLEQFEQAYEAAVAAAGREVKAYQAAYKARTVPGDAVHLVVFDDPQNIDLILGGGE